MISPDSSVGQGYQYFGLQKFLVLGQFLEAVFFADFFSITQKFIFQTDFLSFYKNHLEINLCGFCIV